MPTLSYPLSAVLDRLQPVSTIRLLGLAPDLAAALDTPPRTVPAVFLASSLRGHPFAWSGPLVQQARDTTLNLVLWVRNAGAAAAVAADMEALESAVDARLAGWTPGDAYSSLRLMEAKDEFSQGDYYVRQLAYECQWTFSAQVQT